MAPARISSVLLILCWSLAECRPQISIAYKPNRPFYHPSPGNFGTQLIPPGKPWPAKAEEYGNFTQTTPQVVNRFKENSTTTVRPSGPSGNRPFFHPNPGERVPQIIPPGKPWPANSQGYTNFSQTTPSSLLVNRLKENATTTTVAQGNRPFFHPRPGDNIPQIIPPGKPWPASVEGYANFSQTTPSSNLANRLNDNSTKTPGNRPFFHPNPGERTPQLVPSGEPWPATPEGYANFSQTTPFPTTPTSPSSLVNDLVNIEPISIKINSTKATTTAFLSSEATSEATRVSSEATNEPKPMEITMTVATETSVQITTSSESPIVTQMGTEKPVSTQSSIGLSTSRPLTPSSGHTEATFGQLFTSAILGNRVKPTIANIIPHATGHGVLSKPPKKPQNVPEKVQSIQEVLQNTPPPPEMPPLVPHEVHPPKLPQNEYVPQKLHPPQEIPQNVHVPQEVQPLHDVPQKMPPVPVVPHGVHPQSECKPDFQGTYQPNKGTYRPQSDDPLDMILKIFGDHSFEVTKAVFTTNSDFLQPEGPKFYNYQNGWVPFNLVPERSFGNRRPYHPHSHHYF